MNFLVSYNWLKEVSGTKSTADALAAKMSVHSATAERMKDVGAAFQHMVLGLVKKIEPHPDAHTLKVAIIDIGKKKISVVCGGTNLHEGMYGVVALPGACVRWHGEGDSVILESATIRGVKSNGMLCGADEIGLETLFPHAKGSILDLTELVKTVTKKARPGMALATVLLLEDRVMDFEITTNRVDMMSIEGLAREACAIEGSTHTIEDAPKIESKKKSIAVSIKKPVLCSRYMCVRMNIEKIGQSPYWMRKRLWLAGMTPINCIVDIGNYVMLLCGQPMHAFDGAKIKNIEVRNAKKGETMQLLDSKTYTLPQDVLLITDGQKPLAVAGIMGGMESGINESTTSVVWEAANFSASSIRATSRNLHIRTASSERFEKGLPSYLTERALSLAVTLTQELARGTLASAVTDVHVRTAESTTVMCNPRHMQEIIGGGIDESWAKHTLRILGFKISGSELWEIEVPQWREGEVFNSNDIIEEVARMYGYQNIRGRIPAGFSRAKEHVLWHMRDTVAPFFVHHGFFEMINYAFAPKSEIDLCGADNFLKIANPLSEDALNLRVSLIPSAVRAVVSNERQSAAGRFFEIGNVYALQGTAAQEELRLVAALFDSDASYSFFLLKGIFEAFCVARRIVCTFVPMNDHPLLHPTRSARIMCGTVEIGVIGVLHPDVCRHYDVKSALAVGELSIEKLATVSGATAVFSPLPSFPSVKRDIAFFIDRHTSYADIIQALSHAHPLIWHIALFDVFEEVGVPDGKKSMAFHIEYLSKKKTLSAEEADAAHDAVVRAVESLGGEVRK